MFNWQYSQHLHHTDVNQKTIAPNSKELTKHRGESGGHPIVSSCTTLLYTCTHPEIWSIALNSAVLYHYDLRFMGCDAAVNNTRSSSLLRYLCDFNIFGSFFHSKWTIGPQKSVYLD
jgi:hypothetical protein